VPRSKNTPLWCGA